MSYHPRRPFTRKLNGCTGSIEKIRTKTGVNVTLHGLRHTQATALIWAGVPVKVVSERLGHSTVSVTQDIYAHVLPHMQQKAVGVISETLAQVAGTVEDQADDSVSNLLANNVQEGLQ